MIAGRITCFGFFSRALPSKYSHVVVCKPNVGDLPFFQQAAEPGGRSHLGRWPCLVPDAKGFQDGLERALVPVNFLATETEGNKEPESGAELEARDRTLGEGTAGS